MSKESDEARTREVLEGWRRAAPARGPQGDGAHARALLASLGEPLPPVQMPYSVLARNEARNTDEPALWVGMLRSMPPPERRSYEESMSAAFAEDALRRRFSALVPTDDPLWSLLSDRRLEPVEKHFTFASGPISIGDPWSRDPRCLVELPFAGSSVELYVRDTQDGGLEGLLEARARPGIRLATRNEKLDTETAFFAIGQPALVRELVEGPLGEPAALLERLARDDPFMTESGVVVLAPSPGGGAQHRVQLRKQGAVLVSAKIRWNA